MYSFIKLVWFAAAQKCSPDFIWVNVSTPSGSLGACTKTTIYFRKNFHTDIQGNKKNPFTDSQGNKKLILQKNYNFIRYFDSSYPVLIGEQKCKEFKTAI